MLVFRRENVIGLLVIQPFFLVCLNFSPYTELMPVNKCVCVCFREKHNQPDCLIYMFTHPNHTIKTVLS